MQPASLGVAMGLAAFRFHRINLVIIAQLLARGAHFHPILSPGKANCGSTIAFDSDRRQNPPLRAAHAFVVSLDHIIALVGRGALRLA